MSVKQAHEEVKYYCILWNYLLFTICVPFNVHRFVIYACMQVMNDVEYKLSEETGFRSVDVKEECLSFCSNFSNIEGSSAFDSRLVLYCVHWEAYIYLLLLLLATSMIFI